MMRHHLHMPSYFLGTFTEYPNEKGTETQQLFACLDGGFILTQAELHTGSFVFPYLSQQ